MPELTADDFDTYFKALWGEDHPPFAWQRELAARVIENSWPDAIALPTASGKTACLDIAVFALAAHAARLAPSQPLAAPRRIFFVVDRRVIVDEAFRRASTLAETLRHAPGGVLKIVADQLRSLSGVGSALSIPLSAHELRGGIYRSESWAKSPVQPTIVCSTVDQIGSRLLFRGYGRSWKAWPIHAGLVGNDSLILLDEAHCSQPFLETLRAVKKYRGWAEQPLANPFQMVVMSATPPKGCDDVFHDHSEEPADEHHPLGRRQLASKSVRLAIADKAKGKQGTAQLAQALARAAIESADDQPKAVVVFCNRVDTARKTHEQLAKKYGDNAVLLTGRMRPLDKDTIVRDRLQPLASEVAEQRQLEAPLFVVATQTLEVGADFDFDALVTECASLDALRQRFGRLNRMGRPIGARGAIIIRADQAKDSDDDAVYGSALAKTWQWLEKLEEPNFGISALMPRLPSKEAITELNAPAPSAPIMMPAHVDSWAQTAPVPAPSPDVALFLHGPARTSAFAQVCWRADLDFGDAVQRQSSLDILTEIPPLTAECLPVPIALFRRWLAGESGADESADVEGASVDEESRSEYNGVQRHAVLWRGRDDSRIIGPGEAREIRPGDTLVLPTPSPNYEMLGDLLQYAGAKVFDRADEAYRLMRAKALLRLHPKVIAEWPESDPRTKLLSLLNDADSRFDDDPNSLCKDVQVLLGKLADEAGPDWLKQTARELAADKKAKLSAHPVRGAILRGGKRLSYVDGTQSSFGDEDDATASGTVRVELIPHLLGVAAFARRFAEQCGLPPELVDALERTGLLHDLGKADPRFQALLNGGNPWLQGAMLAKSNNMPQGRQTYLDNCKKVGYPQGTRHELLSVRLAESAAELLPVDAVLRDLVLHLLASHHGRCRPFAPVIFDDTPQEVSLNFQGSMPAHSSATGLERLDSGVSDRYWRLVRRYGWWGLVWLEAIFRLADHRRSEAEQEGQE